LCGHATLAAAHGLYETRRADDDKDIVFHTRESGQLVASRINDDMLGPGVVQLDFPASSVAEYSLSKEEISFLSEGFNISEEIFVTNMLFSGRTTYDLFIEMTPQVFASITTINYRSIAKVGGRGVIITCIGLKHSYNYPNLESTSRLRSDKYDFLSRFFGPWYVCSLRKG
jgi:predicted PhzF superfamily epimerase YddE/YHI9